MPAVHERVKSLQHVHVIHNASHFSEMCVTLDSVLYRDFKLIFAFCDVKTSLRGCKAVAKVLLGVAIQLKRLLVVIDHLIV